MEDELVRLLATPGKRWVLKGIDFKYYFFRYNNKRLKLWNQLIHIIQEEVHQLKQL